MCFGWMLSESSRSAMVRASLTQRIVPPDDAAYKGLLIDCGRRILLGQKAQQ
jgi:hypothetical protein